MSRLKSCQQDICTAGGLDAIPQKSARKSLVKLHNSTSELEYAPRLDWPSKISENRLKVFSR